MTTHGRGPLSRFWLGSVADELVRRTPVPILLVRPGEAGSDLTGRPVLRHVLIPLDGSELAEQVLGPAVALGNLMQGDYTLVRVVPPLVPSGLVPTGDAVADGVEPPPEEVRADAEAYLQRVAGRLKDQSLAIGTHVVVGQRPAQAILEEAQARATDLIALTTHGYRGLTRLLLGSVADKLVRGASTPVLVCRPGGN